MSIFLRRTFIWDIEQSDLTLQTVVSPISGNSASGNMRKGILYVLITFLIDNSKISLPRVVVFHSSTRMKSPSKHK